MEYWKPPPEVVNRDAPKNQLSLVKSGCFLNVSWNILMFSQFCGRIKRWEMKWKYFQAIGAVFQFGGSFWGQENSGIIFFFIFGTHKFRFTMYRLYRTFRKISAVKGLRKKKFLWIKKIDLNLIQECRLLYFCHSRR